MRWEELENEPCSIARSLAVFGDRWTLVLLRECFMGVKKFADFQQNLGISKTIISERLKHLIDHGILEKVAYQQNPPRYKYKLTRKGLDIYPVFLSFARWGDVYCAGEKGVPLVYTHKSCGHQIHAVSTCSECGEPLDARDVMAQPGPGAGPHARSANLPKSKQKVG